MYIDIYTCVYISEDVYNPPEHIPISFDLPGIQGLANEYNTRWLLNMLRGDKRGKKNRKKRVKNQLVIYIYVFCLSTGACVAVCCSVLQRVAVCCSVLQCVAVCCSVLQCVAVCCRRERRRDEENKERNKAISHI